MNSYPLWYKLLHTWCTVKNRSGLTLPFIICAINRINNTPISGKDIEELIFEMANQSLPDLVTIKYCPNLNEDVFYLESRKTKFSFEDGYFSENLYLTQSFLNKFTGQDIQDLIEHFEDHFAGQIMKGGFSKSLLPPQIWKSFNDEDISLIELSKNIEIK